VLGTERHESRRIDNQLRGRSGRQGDPGATRFYLSLEDELMRLFATGLMSRVMNASFPDDVPLESKMVSKAVERAQGTVEGRNFEIRKDVLKYDEMMNEQRKVIYKRRQQILDGEDLRETATEAIANAIGRLVDTFCSGEFTEGWDITGLLDAAKNYFPTRITKDQLDDLHVVADIDELFVADADALYGEKEESVGTDTLRDIERRVMLSVIDQHWREHLYEMDYLQEGINLRAMGQKDPLVEWQREGFEMFGQMMHGISQDFVRYVMHVQVVQEEPPPPPTVQNVSYSAPDDSVPSGMSAAAVGLAVASEDTGSSVATAEAPRSPVQQVVKTEWEKTPRNATCPCGSGKKYKLCHGRDA
jgi:preprotein translocase subunit SecA